MGREKKWNCPNLSPASNIQMKMPNDERLYLYVWQRFVFYYYCTFLVPKWLHSCTVNAFRHCPLSSEWWLTLKLSQNFPPSHHINKPTLTLSRAAFSSCVRNHPADALFTRLYHRDAVVVALLLPGLCDWSNLTHSATHSAPNASGGGWDRKRFIKYKGLERNSCPSKRHRQEIILLWNKWADYGNMWVYA